MRSMILLLVCALSVCAGCGDAKRQAAAERPKVAAQAPFAPDEAVLEGAAPKDAAPEAPGGGAKPVNVPAKELKVDQPRKIKYSADLKVVVTDFDLAWKGLKDAMKDAKALSAKEEIQGSAGTQRSGTWTIRVPVDQIHPFREAVIKLGKPDRNTLSSEDITAEYYDLAEHIKNKQAEREAMRKILEKTGDRDLQQFFTVKRELDAINDHINRKEGQLRLWGNLADLSTVTVNLREVQKFDEEKKPIDREEPSFGQRASKTWDSTWDLFVGFCQWIALVAIALAPWVPIPLVLILALWIVVRLLVRSSKKAAETEVVAVEEVPKKKVKKDDQPETQ